MFYLAQLRSVSVTVGGIQTSITFGGSLDVLKQHIADRVFEYTGECFERAFSGSWNVSIRWQIEINLWNGQTIVVSEYPVEGHHLPSANELIEVFHVMGISSRYYMVSQIASKTCELINHILDQNFSTPTLIILDNPFPPDEPPIIIIS